MAMKKDRPQQRRTKNIEAPEPPEMTVNEVAEAYPEQWILMRVTGQNEHQMPWRGHILAASPDERNVTAALGREPRPSSLPPGAPRPHYYVFQAYPHVFEGEALQTLMSKLCGRGRADGEIAQG